VPLKVTYQGKDTIVPDDATVAIGSDAASTIRIVRPGISRRHAVISKKPSGWTIEDTDSRNGTYRFGQRFESVTITATETVFLGHPTDGEKLMLTPMDTEDADSEPSSSAADSPELETFVLPESAPVKKPESAPEPKTADPVIPQTPTATPAMAPAASPTRTATHQRPRDIEIAQLMDTMQDQINAIKGLTWSVWAMIGVTAALIVLTLFVSILGN